MIGVVMDNWLDFLHIGRHQAYASGHPPMQEIFAPKALLLVHTEHSEMFVGAGKIL